MAVVDVFELSRVCPSTLRCVLECVRALWGVFEFPAQLLLHELNYCILSIFVLNNNIINLNISELPSVLRDEVLFYVN